MLNNKNQDIKLFESLEKVGEWKALGEYFKEIFAEMSREDLERITLEDLDNSIREDFEFIAIALTAKLVYKKLQFDLNEAFPVTLN